MIFILYPFMKTQRQVFGRRQLIKNIGLAAGAIAVAGSSSSAPREKEAKQKRVLRIAHITDVHIRPEHNAPQRFRQPENVITGKPRLDMPSLICLKMEK